jgi:hypothetical protein
MAALGLRLDVRAPAASAEREVPRLGATDRGRTDSPCRARAAAPGDAAGLAEDRA